MASPETLPEPSAPPRWIAEGPPNYQTVAEQEGNTRTRARAFTGSLQAAGASLGRWFGVHDEELMGWRRTGTLPRNQRVVSYALVPEEDPGMEMNPSRDRRHRERNRASGEGQSRLRRITDTLTLRRRRPTNEDVMESLPTFWPAVTVLIALVEVGLLIAVMATNGIAPISFSPQQEFKVIVGFNNNSASVTRKVVPNFFIGPSSQDLVHSGAMYTPCMRQNIEFQINAAKDLLVENNLRCCRGTPPVQQCGMLPQNECVGFGGDVLGGASVCKMEQNKTNQCGGGVTLHPCCVGLLGECILTTNENCTFQEGYWHPDKVLCSEVGTDCFNDICEFTWIHRTIGQFPSQGLRFLAAIFLYQGVIHLILVEAVLKFYISWKVETRIGWLRLTCVYLLSGIGGFLLTGVLDPTRVSVGGSGALFGLFGVLLVELLQGWRLVKRPCVELFKLIVLIVILLALGTLPYINNFSHIGGFIFGALSSFIFVPYIVIGKWDRAKKLCLLLTAIPIILFLFLIGFVVFYNNPNPDFCSWCSYINCIPYTSTFCDDFISAVFSTTPP